MAGASSVPSRRRCRRLCRFAQRRTTSGASDNRNSVLRPPRPAGPLPIDTVVSPPTKAPQALRPAGRVVRPMSGHYMRMPASRAPPWRIAENERRQAVLPRGVSCRSARTRQSHRSTQSASISPALRRLTFACQAPRVQSASGRKRSRRRSRAPAPPCLDRAAIGPDAMAAGSSPGMSEITSVTTRAGRAAAARRPHDRRDACARHSSPKCSRRWRAAPCSAHRLSASDMRPPARSSGPSRRPDETRSRGRRGRAETAPSILRAATSAVFIRHGMRGLDDLDAAGRNQIAVARDGDACSLDIGPGGVEPAAMAADAYRHRRRCSGPSACPADGGRPRRRGSALATAASKMRRRLARARASVQSLVISPLRHGRLSPASLSRSPGGSHPSLSIRNRA